MPLAPYVTPGNLAPGSFPPGTPIPQPAGRSGEAFLAEIHDPLYEQTYAGNMFQATTAEGGVALPRPTTTAPVFALWNPTGSGKNAVLVSLDANVVSGGATIGSLAIANVAVPISAVATNNAVTAFNMVAPANGLIGKGNQTVMNVSVAGTNTITAGALYMGLGWSNPSTTAAANLSQQHYEFRGKVIVPPGQLIHVCSATGAIATAILSLFWYEVAIGI